MKSKISLSKSVLVISIVVSVAMVICLLFLWEEAFVVNGGTTLGKVVYAVVLISFCSCIIFSPRYLKVTDKNLIIQCLAYRTTIPLAEISAIEPTSKYAEYADFRIFGIGGVWGYIGIFRNKGVGTYTSFVGDPKSAFYIKLNSGKKYLVSCDDAEQFVTQLQK